MTPAEALERVRALAEARNAEVRDLYPSGSRTAEEVVANGRAQISTSDVLAILDAVTPDAPVTVEGLTEAVGRHMFENRTLGLDQDPDEENEWEILPWRDEWIEGAEIAIEGIRRAGYVLTPATPERTEQDHEVLNHLVGQWLNSENTPRWDLIESILAAGFRRSTPERTEQEREAAVKHDPRAHAKVGDRASSNAGMICEAVDAGGYWCTREEGHPGHHIAEDVRAVVAVWGAQGREVSE